MVPTGKLLILKFWLDRFCCPDKGLDSDGICEINISFSNEDGSADYLSKQSMKRQEAAALLFYVLLSS